MFDQILETNQNSIQRKKKANLIFFWLKNLVKHFLMEVRYSLQSLFFSDFWVENDCGYCGTEREFMKIIELEELVITGVEKFVCFLTTLV